MHVVVIGCGRVGASLARTLALRGDTLGVVDSSAPALDRVGTYISVERIHGDGCDRNVLERAGVDTADALAAVTGSDEVNAVVARLAAITFRVPRAVARIYDPAKAEIYRHLGVQTVAPVSWSAQRLVELVTFSELAPVASLGTGQVEIVDATVPALLEGRPASELCVPGEATVVAITRGGSTSLVASLSTPLRAGDVAHVAVTSTAGLEAIIRHHE